MRAARTDANQPDIVRDSLRERFDSKWTPEPNTGCWLWFGATSSHGYGALKVNGSQQRVHRVSWFLDHGRWPEQCVLHRCDNPPCVNPAHLFEGTHLDNMTDRRRKRRAAKGVRNGRAKLTEGQIREIRARYATGDVSAARLGREFGVSSWQTHRIVRSEHWRHVT